MIWEVRIQYSNVLERVLFTCNNRETALGYVDAIYAQGYPMHLAFIVCFVTEAPALQSVQQDLHSHGYKRSWGYWFIEPTRFAIV